MPGLTPSAELIFIKAHGGTNPFSPHFTKSAKSRSCLLLSPFDLKSAKYLYVFAVNKYCPSGAFLRQKSKVIQMG